MQLKRILILAMLLISSAGELIASNDCCESACDYLAPCGWSVQVQGGVNPIVWAKRDNSFWVDGLGLPSFLHLFKIPWIVGGKVGYNLNGCTEIYVEGDYTQARGKHRTFSATSPLNGLTNFVAELSKYKAYGVWGGARYYFGLDCLSDCSCFIDRAAFFIGLQVGFVHHNQLDVALTSTTAVGYVTGPVFYQVFFKNYTISAGGNVGVDFAVNDCFSVVFTAEFLGNGASRSCPVGCSGTPLAGLYSEPVNVGFDTELWFPVTLGLKYNF